MSRRGGRSSELTPEARQRGGPRGPLGLRLVLGVLLVLLLAAPVVVWYVRGMMPRPVVEVPTVNVPGAERAVVAAVESARQTVLQDPARSAAWGNLGMVLYAHNYTSEARRCFAEAGRLDPADCRWTYLEGMIVAETDTSAALPYLERACELADDAPAIQLRLAEFLFDVQRLEESERHFQRALALEPQDVRGPLGLARIALERDQLDEALRWARRALELAPDLRPLHQLLAQIYQQQANAQGIAFELKVLRELPDQRIQWPDPILAQVAGRRVDSDALSAQAEQLAASGRMEDRLLVLQQLVQNHPEDPTWSIYLALALVDYGRLPAAVLVLDEALARHPDATEVRFRRALLARQAGGPAEAVSHLQQVVAEKPDFAEAQLNLGQCLTELQDLEGAIAAYRHVTRFEPLFAPARLELARLLIQVQQPEAARVELEQVLRLQPGQPEAQKMLAALKPAGS